MITHVYKCSKCNELKEVEIQTYDITKGKGVLDLEKYDKRISEPRSCDCGGELKHQITDPGKALWFDDPLRGKVSQRFA